MRGERLGVVRVSRVGVCGALVEGRFLRGDIELVDGVITRVGMDASGSDSVGTAIAVPGMVDLQVNGAVGVDLRDADRDGYGVVGAFLASRGATAAQPTFYSQDIDSYRRALGRLGEVLADPPSGARWLPAHLEGPFLSMDRSGAHRSEDLLGCDPAVLQSLLAAGSVGFMTIAPELPGAIDLIAQLVESRVVVSIGHTDADVEQVMAAVDAGARHVTHCWNAMRPISARDPGPIGVALSDSRLTVGVIADLVHVAAPVLAFSAAAARGRQAATTDAVLYAGMDRASWRTGPDLIGLVGGAPRAADGTICGGIATPDQCLRNLLDAGLDLADAVDACGGAQRRLLGLDPVRLVPGETAEFVVLDDAMSPLRTIVDGRWFEPS